MEDIDNKENLSPVRRSPSKRVGASLSPAKPGKKPRSKSIGPGGLDGVAEQKTRASPNKNRRKSSFAPAVKSILPSKEDEAKRREARRKSLANRRVSFAPEATLHTWDVIEYMRETTTSSASSEHTRRASSATTQSHDFNSDPTDPPSTPPEQADEPTLPLPSPAHQRDLHQKKRRRSSAIPPLNFNDPEEDFSSSPASGSSPMTGSDGVEDESEDDNEDDEDGESTAMSLDGGDSTADVTMRSEDAESTSESSARLEAALTQAARQAGTRGIDYDEHGEMSMEIATEEVTNAFKPWAQQSVGLTPMAKNLIALQDQENINPFSPAFRAGIGPKRPSTMNEVDDEDDMSMDMTRVVGGIMGAAPRSQMARFADDETMELTQAVGKIYQPASMRVPQLKSALKRRLSTTEDGSPMPEQGSPQKQSQIYPNKRQRSSADRSSFGDATMDLTTTIGGIEGDEQDDSAMDLTMAVGCIQNRGSPSKTTRRSSLRSRRSSALSSMMDEQTMDFTTAVGAIKTKTSVQNVFQSAPSDQDDNEEMSMELTIAIGNIANTEAAEEVARPMTPRNTSSTPRIEPPMTPTDQDRFKEATDMSAKKLLTPILEHEARPSPKREFLSGSKSPRTSGRHSARNHSPAIVAKTSAPPANNLESSQKSPTLSEAKDRSTGTPNLYPQLPAPKLVLTPQSSPNLVNGAFDQDAPTTPVHEQVLQRDIPSPMLDKQMRSSPYRATSSPHIPIQEPSKSLSESIRMLSTPRKEAPTSPLKRLKEMTPKKTPVRKAMTPRMTATPKAEIDFASAKKEDHDPVSRQLSDDLLRSIRKSAPATKIRLNDFLDMAGIRFMDLTTTKRRYTAAPTPVRANQAMENNADEQDSAELLEDAVVAGACTVPELDLYQHSCRELKRYISEGKTFLKNLESEVYREPPPLIQAYVTASPESKMRLDTHMRDAKTEARLQSKKIWYGWRSQLLQGLEDGLAGIKNGMDDDAALLAEREAIIEQFLPSLLEQQESMQEEAQRLEEEAASVSEEDGEELDSVREQLAEMNQEVAERRCLFKCLEEDFAEQEKMLDDYEETKIECLGAIQESDRLKESCRGWSIDEVTQLKESVSQLESETGWSVASAASTTLTMVYHNQIQLFFDTAAFSPCRSVSSPRKRENRPISLTYVADSHEYRPGPLTTEKRFFLQLMRAQLQCLVQHQTSIKDLLSFVSDGWNATTKIHETLRRLQMENIMDVSILSDERLGIRLSMLLPKVETKVRLHFELRASIGFSNGNDQAFAVQTDLKVAGKVVYGEHYKEQKMGDFVMNRVGGGLEGWEDAVRDLKARLVATGRKGTQV